MVFVTHSKLRGWKFPPAPVPIELSASSLLRFFSQQIFSHSRALVARLIFTEDFCKQESVSILNPSERDSINTSSRVFGLVSGVQAVVTDGRRKWMRFKMFIHNYGDVSSSSPILGGNFRSQLWGNRRRKKLRQIMRRRRKNCLTNLSVTSPRVGKAFFAWPLEQHRLKEKGKLPLAIRR